MSPSSLRARAFWTLAPSSGQIREEPLGEPGPGEVLVRARYGAVSRGTEVLVFQGRVPPSEYERMRCPHQAGAFPGPLKYGYSNVGTVLAGAPELLGRTVFCLYPHQTHYVVPESAVIPVPATVPPERAVLAANLETALNALWDVRPLVGDRITVVGGGAVGCLATYLACRIPGTDVELVDVRESRRAIAEALGARFATPETARRERDVVIHASATSAGLATAFSVASRETAVVELSWYGDRPVTLTLGEDFHVRRLGLRSSQVGTVSPNARARVTHRSRLALALELCADPVLERLIDDEGDFEALPTTLERLSRPDVDVVCHRVVYPREPRL